MKKILCVIGTRPQAIKHLPFQKTMEKEYEIINLHTGQHFDHEMKAIFIQDINLDNEIKLEASDRQSRMKEMSNYISQYIEEIEPDMVVVYGDTDTTLAAAQSSINKNISLCHIEAGLRSYNIEMPEEVNRIETDRLSHLLLCPSQTAVNQLYDEGISNGVYLVGDIMKDAILMNQNKERPTKDQSFYYSTLHRPYNVDEKIRLKYILGVLNSLDEKVIFPLHPRTERNMKKFNISKSDFKQIEFVPPQSYLSNLNYMIGSRAILTDSGGMQKEAYWLKKKCITLRSETEWNETLVNGCNVLLFENLSLLQEKLNEKAGPWDADLYGNGNASKNIKDAIDEYFKTV